MTMTRTPSRMNKQQRGVAIIEFAIVLPILLMLVMGTAEFGRAFLQYNALTKTLRDGGRYVAAKAVKGSTGVVQINANVRTETSNLVTYGNVAGTGTPLLPGLVPGKRNGRRRCTGVRGRVGELRLHTGVSLAAALSIRKSRYTAAAFGGGDDEGAMKSLRRQRGLVALEVALIGMIAMVALFAVFEVARVFFVFNALEEATRRGARLAAVCPVNDPAVPGLAVFNNSGGASSPLIYGLSSANMEIGYLSDMGAVVGDLRRQLR